MPLSVKAAGVWRILRTHGRPGAECSLVQFSLVIQQVFVEHNIRCQHCIGGQILLHIR